MGLLGLRQRVIGSDGRPLGVTAYGVVNETIASGQTFDMLTSVPAGTTTGTRFALYNAGLYLHNSNQRRPDNSLAFGGMMTFINTVTGAAARKRDQSPTWASYLTQQRAARASLLPPTSTTR